MNSRERFTKELMLSDLSRLNLVKVFPSKLVEKTLQSVASSTFWLDTITMPLAGGSASSDQLDLLPPTKAVSAG